MSGRQATNVLTDAYLTMAEERDRLRAALAAERKLTEEAAAIIARYAENEDDRNAGGEWADDTNPAHDWLTRYTASREGR